MGKRLRIEPMLASTEEASNGMNTVRVSLPAVIVCRVSMYLVARRYVAGSVAVWRTASLTLRMAFGFGLQDSGFRFSFCTQYLSLS